MKKVLILLILLLPAISAESLQYGKIRVDVLNRPPKITSLSLTPDAPYYDDTLICNAQIDDNAPDSVSVLYTWYKNGQKLDTQDNTLQDFSDNDDIRCEAVAVDDGADMSKQIAATTTIQPSSLQVKFMKPMLNAVGVEVRAGALQDTASMQAVTGMVTGTREANGFSILYLLGIIALLLVVLNSIIIFRKIRSPRQDSLSS